MDEVDIGQEPSDQAGEGKSVCVSHTHSILCVGQVKDIPGAGQRWKGQIEDLKMYSSYRDAVRIDGEAIEFEWTMFPGFSSLSILHEIRRDLEKEKHPGRRLQGPDHLHVDVQ